MLIVVVLLSLVQFSTAAIPTIKEQDPAIKVVHDVEGVLYEIPEYEDPQLVDYELSLMGGSPVLSLVQVAKKQISNKNKNIPYKENVDKITLELDDILTRLHEIRKQFQKGSSDMYFEDIEKSMQALKKLERNPLSNIYQLLKTLHKSISLSKSVINHEMKKAALTTKANAIETPMYEIIPLAADAPVSPLKPPPTVDPVYDESEEEVTKLPSAQGVYKSENKKDEEGKSALKSKVTWKSSRLI